MRRCKVLAATVTFSNNENNLVVEVRSVVLNICATGLSKTKRTLYEPISGNELPQWVNVLCCNCNLLLGMYG